MDLLSERFGSFLNKDPFLESLDRSQKDAVRGFRESLNPADVPQRWLYVGAASDASFWPLTTSGSTVIEIDPINTPDARLAEIRRSYPVSHIKNNEIVVDTGRLRVVKFARFQDAISPNSVGTIDHVISTRASPLPSAELFTLLRDGGFFVYPDGLPHHTDALYLYPDHLSHITDPTESGLFTWGDLLDYDRLLKLPPLGPIRHSKSSPAAFSNPPYLTEYGYEAAPKRPLSTEQNATLNAQYWMSRVLDLWDYHVTALEGPLGDEISEIRGDPEYTISLNQATQLIKKLKEQLMMVAEPARHTLQTILSRSALMAGEIPDLEPFMKIRLATLRGILREHGISSSGM